MIKYNSLAYLNDDQVLEFDFTNFQITYILIFGISRIFTMIFFSPPQNNKAHVVSLMTRKRIKISCFLAGELRACSAYTYQRSTLGLLARVYVVHDHIQTANDAFSDLCESLRSVVGAVQNYTMQ